MTLEEYDQLCGSLVATTKVVQWGGAHVWKVAGKVFAIAGRSDQGAAEPFITFKCSEVAFEVLRDTQGMRPAPYLASRGMKWIQVMDHEVLGDAELAECILCSYQLVAAGLPARTRREIGLP